MPQERKPREALEHFTYPTPQCRYCGSTAIRVTGNTRTVNNLRKRDARCDNCRMRFVMVMTISELIPPTAIRDLDTPPGGATIKHHPVQGATTCRK